MTHNNAAVLLKVSDVKVGYGGIQAVKGVSLEVREGELVSLIGSNGCLWVAATLNWQVKPLRVLALGTWCNRAWPWCPKVAVCSRA